MLSVVLLAVLGVLVVRPLLSGPGSAGEQAAPLPQSLPPAITPTETTTPKAGTAPGASSARVLSSSIARRTAKDPFVPLVNEDQSAVTTATGNSGGSSTTSGSSGSSSSGSSAKDNLAGVSTTTGGHSPEVTVTVGGTRYTGEVGDTLAGTYEVVSITTECADFRADGEVSRPARPLRPTSRSQAGTDRALAGRPAPGPVR